MPGLGGTALRTVRPVRRWPANLAPQAAHAPRRPSETAGLGIGRGLQRSAPQRISCKYFGLGPVAYGGQFLDVVQSVLLQLPQCVIGLFGDSHGRSGTVQNVAYCAVFPAAADHLLRDTWEGRQGN